MGEHYSHHKPTKASRTNVRKMCEAGIPQEAIATVMDCDPKTLRKHYRDELDTAKTKKIAGVAGNLIRKAMGNGPQATLAAIFYLKCQGGWIDKQHIEHGGSVRLAPANLESLDSAQLRALAGMADALLPPAAAPRFGEIAASN